MRNAALLITQILLFILNGNAQNQKELIYKYEFGGEGGLTIDYLKSNDQQGNIFSSRYLFSGLGGPKLRRYWSKDFFSEFAVLFKENVFGIRLKTGSDFTTNGSQLVMIPLRAGYKWDLSRKMSFDFVTGLVPTFITIYADGSGSAIYSGVISYSYSHRDKNEKSYLTIQPGASFSHLIMNRIKFSLGVNYYIGLKDTEITDIYYSTLNGTSDHTTMTRKGTFINYNGGLTYLFDLKKKSR